MRKPAIPSFFKRIQPKGKIRGWLSLSPLLLFILLYLTSSLLAHDFYRISITAIFALTAVYSILLNRLYEPMEKTISVFSDGAGNQNVLQMIWIFVLAGAFAATAKELGAIDATVNLTLSLLPSRFLLIGLFLAACFISFSIGTSVGTIVALVPITTAIAEGQPELSAAMLTACIIGGAFFGDNLSFISDTTIAATQSQGCSMRDKFRVNLLIALPAALLVAALYLWIGHTAEPINSTAVSGHVILVLPYLLIILLGIIGVNVVTVLTIGILTNGIFGWVTHTMGWVEWLSSIGNGIQQMGELIIVTMLAGGILEIIRYNGGLQFIIDRLSNRISTKRGAELAIAAIVSFANLCTANNTIAIISVAPIAKDITKRFSLDPRKTASILDTFSCLVQGIIPYGAQLLMAAALADVSSFDIIPHLYYPFVLGLTALFCILCRLPRRYS